MKKVGADFFTNIVKEREAFDGTDEQFFVKTANKIKLLNVDGIKKALDHYKVEYSKDDDRAMLADLLNAAAEDAWRFPKMFLGGNTRLVRTENVVAEYDEPQFQEEMECEECSNWVPVGEIHILPGGERVCDACYEKHKHKKPELEPVMGDGGQLGEWMGTSMMIGDLEHGHGKAQFKEIVEFSKKYPKNIYIFTDDNYAHIGNYWLKNGKFTKADTWGNPLYDLQHPIKLTGKDDVIYKFKKINKEEFYENGGTIENWEHLFSNPGRFMRYDGQFLYPPRVESLLQPKSLDILDNGEYVGQPKFNGSATSVIIGKDKVEIKERHNTFFAIPPKFDFHRLYRGSGYMCLAGEFMNKSKKDQTGQPFRGFVIWDITAFDGKVLVGSTIEERLNLINLLYPSTGYIAAGGLVDGKRKDINYLYTIATPFIFKAANFYSGFKKDYDVLTKVEMIEGFVMKRKNGKLEYPIRMLSNTGWSCKVRKPTKNYNF